MKYLGLIIISRLVLLQLIKFIRGDSSSHPESDADWRVSKPAWRLMPDHFRSYYHAENSISLLCSEKTKSISEHDCDTAIPLITKMADCERYVQGQALAMLRQDVYATHLRQGAEALRYQTAVRNEYTQPLCIL